eukprot:scaffold2299_cov131-Cylindrotheca_fusiformis.AAC.9
MVGRNSPSDAASPSFRQAAKDAPAIKVRKEKSLNMTTTGCRRCCRVTSLVLRSWMRALVAGLLLFSELIWDEIMAFSELSELIWDGVIAFSELIWDDSKIQKWRRRNIDFILSLSQSKQVVTFYFRRHELLTTSKKQALQCSRLNAGSGAPVLNLRGKDYVSFHSD